MITIDLTDVLADIPECIEYGNPVTIEYGSPHSSITKEVAESLAEAICDRMSRRWAIVSLIHDTFDGRITIDVEKGEF